MFRYNMDMRERAEGAEEVRMTTGRVRVSMPFNPVELIPDHIPNLTLLRLVIIIHFTLVTLALLGSWAPLGYAFYNAFLLAGLLWVQSVPSEVTPFSLLVCLVFNAVAILLDIIAMSVAQSTTLNGVYRGWNAFTLFVAIINLLARIPACLLIAKVRSDRMREIAEETTYPEPHPSVYASSPPPVYHPPTIP